MRWLLALGLCAGACTPRAVTPPSRTFVMDSPSDLDVGSSDVQIDAARIGMMWGPELTGGNARLRHTVEPGVTVEADAGVLHVTNSGEAGDRNGYTGRLGLLLHSQDKHWAFGAGVGGGTSATAGNWSAADVHGVVSGANRYVRPVLSGGVGYNAPLGERRTFVVPGGEDGPTTLRLPRNVLTQVTLGLEVGPPRATFLVGASLLRFWLRESSVVGSESTPEDVYLAAGVGLRIGI